MQIGDIGLLGTTGKDSSGNVVECVDIYVGGGIGQTSAIGTCPSLPPPLLHSVCHSLSITLAFPLSLSVSVFSSSFSLSVQFRLGGKCGIGMLLVDCENPTYNNYNVAVQACLPGGAADASKQVHAQFRVCERENES